MEGYLLLEMAGREFRLLPADVMPKLGHYLHFSGGAGRKKEFCIHHFTQRLPVTSICIGLSWTYPEMLP